MNRLALVLIAGMSFSSLFSSTAHAWWMWTPGDTVDNVGYKPEQPIAFDHQKHVVENKIQCEYCHSSARRSASAGIPPLNTCMGCHNTIATDKPEIQKITEHWNKKEPIEWVKVHDLPDYVRFTHKRHVAAGLECQDCHGQVEKMGVAEQGAPLQMGWCIGCHREKQAPINCYTCHY